MPIRATCTSWPSIPAFVAASLLLATTATQAARADDDLTPLERTSTCRKRAWFLTEQRLLAGWGWAAGTNGTDGLPAYIAALEASKQVQPYSLTTTDGRVLRGRKASFSDGKSDVAVIIASGNVATADFMIRRLEPLLRATRHDFYFIDYRGYGRSQDSHPSLQAFIQDFVSLGEDIRQHGYRKILAYGPSLGGIVLLNAAAKGLKLDRLIVDSVPSKLNRYKCDASIAPVTVVRSSCPGVVAVSSKNDGEVSPAEQKDLLEKVAARSCSGRVLVLPNAIHPLNDRPGSSGDLERLTALEKLLLED
jgi:hypothetical protein